MSSFLPSDNADTAGNLENQPAPVDLANQQLKILSPDPRKPRTSRFSPLCASSGGSGHTASNASNPSSAASTPGARFAQRFHVSASSPSPISALSHSHHISTGSSSSSEDTAATRTSISTSISISTTGHSNTTVSGASTISTAPAPTATATAPTPLSTFSPVLSTPVSRPPHRTPLTQSHTPSRAPHTPSRTLHTPSHTPHTPTPATPTSTPHSQPTPATPELFSSPESTRHRRRKTPGWINNHAWRLGEKIGSGSFGEVYQGLNDRGKLFAAKRMNVSMGMEGEHEGVQELLGEILLMRGLSHPHIVGYIGAWLDEDQEQLYIFQEWVPGGSLSHLLKHFGAFALGMVREYTRQICLGLAYLHENGIIHRDVKASNILVDAHRTVKLADFGASTRVTDFDKSQDIMQSQESVKGTPYFMAPEVLAAGKYGRKGDVWAVGCTMIQMLTGQPPWKELNLKGLVQLHVHLACWEGGPPLPPLTRAQVTPEAMGCLDMCFQKVETHRPLVPELLSCAFLMQQEEPDSDSDSSEGGRRWGGGSGDGRVGWGQEREGRRDTIEKIQQQIQKGSASKTHPTSSSAPPSSSAPHTHTGLRSPPGKARFGDLFPTSTPTTTSTSNTVTPTPAGVCGIVSGGIVSSVSNGVGGGMVGVSNVNNVSNVSTVSTVRPFHVHMRKMASPDNPFARVLKKSP